MRLDDLYLVDIVEAHEAIVRMIGDCTTEAFVADETLAAAVQMKLVVIGEAVSALTEATRNRMVGIPVREVRALRNRIVHGYFTVDDRLIHEIAT